MRFRFVFVLLLCLAGVVACRTEQSAGKSVRVSQKDVRRDLSIDENRGGHTLARHVGKTDEQLRARLRKEPNISAASTYVDRDTAEHVIGSTLSENSGKIERWRARGSRRPNLVLDYTAGDDPIGRVMYRRAQGSVPCERALVVLRAYGDDYFVLTSYPDCRP
ncbi:MAG TPA: RNase A-like domain-containing protein [Terriglobales bacterium]|nr:RNase A-like domain-containing protein [Terriglobales bacterium]